MGTKDLIKLKRKKRILKHKQIRKNCIGTKDRPRMNVFKSNKHIYVQIIDDVEGNTIVSASTIDNELKKDITETGVAAAKKVGQSAAKRALSQGIKSVKFDRGGYLYKGCIKALADAARSAGLKF
jgi:large subunit ribosomal protein L18